MLVSCIFCELASIWEALETVQNKLYFKYSLSYEMFQTVELWWILCVSIYIILTNKCGLFELKTFLS